MSRRWKIILALGGVLLLSVASCAGYLVREFWLCGEQMGIYLDMWTYTSHIEEYHEQHGAYPPSLADALPDDLREFSRTDRWGNAYLYESSAEGFVLVSLGRDGERDYADYWSVRAGPVGGDGPSDEDVPNVLGQFDADQIRSDRGWHQHAAP